MAITPFTVSQVNEFISRMFKTEPLLRPVAVKGEISYLNYHSNGNIYLSISDSKSKLDGVVFSNRITDTARSLSVGDEVILTGNMENFPAQSKYSLWVNSVEMVGEGDLAIAFEKLKKKLNEEGLFDKEHKKPLPEYPKHIGVITSATGAAVKDILKILTDRTKLTDITVFPVLVQGPGAPSDIVRMLKIVENQFFGDVDLIILGRGGGSSEDLSVFNDEGIARAIYDCKIPVISAVGHEIDTTISDFVADARAETPTAAAQMAVRNIVELRDTMTVKMNELNRELANRIMNKDFQVRGAFDILTNKVNELFLNGKNAADKYALILEENDPRKILSKGYALVTDAKGCTVTTASGIKSDNAYSIRFEDGSAEVVGR